MTIHFEPPKRGQPLYKGQDVWSQGVLNMEGLLYSIVIYITARAHTLHVANAVIVLLQFH